MAIYKSRKGQGWVLDFVGSILIFIIAITLAVKIITSVYVSEFDDVRQSSIMVSEHLLNQGYPYEWNPDNVIRVGLTTSKNRLNKAKLENFKRLNYNVTKRSFGTRYDYTFYFENKNGDYIGMGTECAIGSKSISENKSYYQDIQKSAYYYKDESQMNAWMTSFGADFYDGDVDSDADTFYNNLSSYALVVMENPIITEGGSLLDIQKKTKLEEYVSNGGLLFLSENVSMNITGVGFQITAQHDGEVTEDEDQYLELTMARRMEDNDLSDASWAVVDISSTAYAELAEYDSTAEHMIARWWHGSGQVYYFNTFNQVYKAVIDLPFRDKVGEAVNNAINITTANCTAIGTPSSDNIAKTERLAIYDSEIVKMVVLSWS
ncbi:hypothetical protein ACFL1B_01400 [Nanoarchaeota archaeon]